MLHFAVDLGDKTFLSLHSSAMLHFVLILVTRPLFLCILAPCFTLCWSWWQDLSFSVFLHHASLCVDLGDKTSLSLYSSAMLHFVLILVTRPLPVCILAPCFTLLLILVTRPLFVPILGLCFPFAVDVSGKTYLCIFSFPASLLLLILVTRPLSVCILVSCFCFAVDLGDTTALCAYSSSMLHFCLWSWRQDLSLCAF